MSVENCEEDDFYFESDHLALRGNNDYSELLKTMFVLEAQRLQAIQDFNKVVELKRMYQKNPLLFASRKESNELGIPEMLKTANLPEVNWSKYNTSVPEQYIQHINALRTNNTVDMKLSVRRESWTSEEQRKLEELLVKYPPEAVERRRYKKIANELGNRTPEQVASRLQKYFQKLLNAGLPVPGRVPKFAVRYFRSHINKKTQGYYYTKYLKPSTFFPDSIIPVAMDDQFAPGPSSSQPCSSKDVSPEEKAELSQSNYLLENSYHLEKKKKMSKPVSDIEIGILKWAKIEKLIEMKEETIHQHYGYKCDYCELEPLPGARWHCITCVNNAVDYCTDCMLTQFYSMDSHDITHKFIIVRNDKQVNSGPWTDSESDSSEESDSNTEKYNDDVDSDLSEPDNMTKYSKNSSPLSSISYTNGES